MSSPAIRVEGLSKRYKLGLTHAGSIREVVNRGCRRLLRRGDDDAAGAPGRCDAMSAVAHDSDRIEDGWFWALRDVSFEVQPGEVVGIIGKNGAGKSTLLKILSRITRPTSGRCTLRGRVASLLEVGTGFHPELTGRENVYMNGAILGMNHREIARRFDEIVAFANMDKFIDTPVKRYSSGMAVRLGFAVAAHLEPDVLIVDEVLAVGDAEFQRKCMALLDSIGELGRAILLVSHQLGAIRRTCKRTLMLANGRIEIDAETGRTLDRYLGGTARTSSWTCGEPEGTASGPLAALSVSVENAHGVDSFSHSRRSAICVRLAYRVVESLPASRVGFWLECGDGTFLLESYDTDHDRLRPRTPGVYECRWTIPAGLLNRGDYFVGVNAGSPNFRNYINAPRLARFHVDDDVGDFGHPGIARRGLLAPLLDCQSTPLTSF